jgi:hypothetical protein
MPRLNDHTHKYKKQKLGEQIIFRCMLPNCSHYVLAELISGRATICWRCDKETIITPQMAKQTKPHCRDCDWSHVGVAGRRKANDADRKILKGAFEI